MTSNAMNAVALALILTIAATGRVGLARDDEKSELATAGNQTSIAVETPEKDGVKVYNINEGNWYVYRAPKGVRSRPFAGANYIATVQEGPKVTQLAAFSDPLKKWSTLDLPEPVKGELQPILGPNLAVYVDGRKVYAFSALVGKWAVLELPEGAKPSPITNALVATVEHDDRLYIFNARFGRWDDSGSNPR